MQFEMILGSSPDVSGLEGVYLEYVKFPMLVYDPEWEEEGNGERVLTNMDQLRDWAMRYFDGDYEIITLDAAFAQSTQEA